ncbi:MAG: funZ protein [Flavobacterium johnsoniae]|nr:MAG: funZ protein [Flavobacterium johnsoniae]
MKEYKSLNLGFGDAENYKDRKNKDLLNRYFVRTEELYEILNPNKYFLIGDKGTGKTAFSLFLTNNDFGNTTSHLNYIRETEYVKFIQLKKEKHLTLTDYTNIWKVLIYTLLSQQVDKGENNAVFSRFSKFNALKQALDEFYKSAFSPEIIYALNVIEETREVAELLNKTFKLSGEDKTTQSFTESKFQINLLYIQNKFEEAFSTIRLERNHILFIDGIDIRPRNIEYEDYLECVKGLANAVWTLNNDFFSKLKGQGRIKVMILVRPDIFSHLGLQNLNNKVRDNSVLMDWKTTYPIYRNSNLFKLADNILNAQQEKNHPTGESWDYYFPFKVNVNGYKKDSFVSFLRFSMFRPRDIVTMMKILQLNIKSETNRKLPIIDQKDFDSSTFRKEYSDYLLGEVKDYLAFYHSDADYELFLKFFEFLDGRAEFNYDEYMAYYEQFANYVEKNNIIVPVFFESSDSFLQFLYDLNVISYVEDTENSEPHIRWSFRERTYSNVNPKVKEGVRYFIHYGLQKAFKTGSKYQKRVINQNRRRINNNNDTKI